jgi:hypothetical protein
MNVLDQKKKGGLKKNVSVFHMAAHLSASFLAS